MSRLIGKINKNGFGNVLDQKQYSRLFGTPHAGGTAGVIIPTTTWITPLSDEPPIAKTKGWGIVPGSPN